MSRNKKPVIEWGIDEVEEWCKSMNLYDDTSRFFCQYLTNGKILLTTTADELRTLERGCVGYSSLKEFMLALRQLQLENIDSFVELGYDPVTYLKHIPPHLIPLKADHDKSLPSCCYCHNCCPKCSSVSPLPAWAESSNGCNNKSQEDDSHVDQKPDVAFRLEQEHQRFGGRIQGDGSELDSLSAAANHGQPLITSHGGGHPGLATRLLPEVWKAVIAMAYLFIVTWITAFVMVIVHDRVPDMKKYPPLPDIFLDNVPHIPWAFHMCEVTGTILLIIWIGVLLFHKHRFILLRRFFALSGTVFLLRCVTMLITSLSVPGSHLQCNPRPYGDIWAKAHQAYLIWKGAGMSIQGVRTCGDYMFSGHTVALTMLNFFITEYTPRYLYFIHTFTWLLNMFGIFFILSAHEHYSIDVFVAFYITSRLFLYYHTLASHHRSLMRRDTGRTRIWFPLLAFFEASVDGTVPNEYEWPTLSTLLPGLPINAIKRKIMHIVGSYLVWKNPMFSSPPTPAKHSAGMQSCHGDDTAKVDKEEKVS